MGRRSNKFSDVFRHINMKPSPPLTCWLWTREGSINSKGIPELVVNGRKYAAYRIVYWLTHPEWDIMDRKSLILHTCTDALGRNVDNPLCCNPAHLRPGSDADNMLDMMLRGRKGLTIDAVRDILETNQKFPDLTHSQIASMVSHRHQQNVARQTVTDILHRRRRRALQEDLAARSREIDESGKGNT